MCLLLCGMPLFTSLQDWLVPPTFQLQCCTAVKDIDMIDFLCSWAVDCMLQRFQSNAMFSSESSKHAMQDVWKWRRSSCPQAFIDCYKASRLNVRNAILIVRHIADPALQANSRFEPPTLNTCSLKDIRLSLYMLYMVPTCIALACSVL